MEKETRSVSYFVPLKDIGIDPVFNGREYGTEEAETSKSLLAFGMDVAANQLQDAIVVEFPSNPDRLDDASKDIMRRTREAFPDCKYLVVAGNRRFQALKLAEANGVLPDGFQGLRVRKLDWNGDIATIRRVNIVENASRRALSPSETAKVVMRMSEVEGFSGKAIAESFGKTAAWVSQVKTLQNLCLQAWKALEVEAINMAQAMELAKMPEHEQIKAIREGLSASEIKAERQAANAETSKSDSAGARGGNRESGKSASYRNAKEFILMAQTLNEFCKRAGIAKQGLPPEVAMLDAVLLWFKGGANKEQLLERLGKIHNGQRPWDKLGETGQEIKPTKEDREAALEQLAGNFGEASSALDAEETGVATNEASAGESGE